MEKKTPSLSLSLNDHHLLLGPLGPQEMLVRLKHPTERGAQLRVDRVDLLLRRRVALHDVDRVPDDGEDLLLVGHREAVPVELLMLVLVLGWLMKREKKEEKKE